MVLSVERFQFPIWDFYFWIIQSSKLAISVSKISIPYLGFLFLNPPKQPRVSEKHLSFQFPIWDFYFWIKTSATIKYNNNIIDFNSLFGIFIFESWMEAPEEPIRCPCGISIPYLGFLFLNQTGLCQNNCRKHLFQFPIWDFYFWIKLRRRNNRYQTEKFQFPIWDFYFWIEDKVYNVYVVLKQFQFPIWDFYFWIPGNEKLDATIWFNFNSLFGIFIFESRLKEDWKHKGGKNISIPYLGFLFLNLKISLSKT